MTVLEFTEELKKRKGDERYSENLLKFMLKFSERGYRNSKIDVCKSGYGILYIGILETSDEHWNGSLSGIRLNAALHDGSMRNFGCFLPPKAPAKFTPIKNWIPKYLSLGKCALDPQHSWYSERWETKGKKRTCKWCGHTQKQVTVTRKEQVWQSTPNQ